MLAPIHRRYRVFEFTRADGRRTVNPEDHLFPFAAMHPGDWFEAETERLSSRSSLANLASVIGKQRNLRFKLATRQAAIGRVVRVTCIGSRDVVPEKAPDPKPPKPPKPPTNRPKRIEPDSRPAAAVAKQAISELAIGQTARVKLNAIVVLRVVRELMEPGALIYATRRHGDTVVVTRLR